jgi:predicted outer membrane repeat protein
MRPGRPILATTLLAAVGLAAPVAADCGSGAKLLRVPEDCSTPAGAVAAIGDGGTIDLAAGTYAFPGGGLDLGRKGKAMTLRARVPRQVTFTGSGTGVVARIDQGAAGGPPIVFEGIRFVDGASASPNRAGGVTLSNAEATFVDCDFERNRNLDPTTGGGALGLYGGSRAIVVRSTFTDNSALNNGGAIYVARTAEFGRSSLWITSSTFRRNSTAGPGFTRTSSGGAIYVRDAELRIADSELEENSAGWVGGALYGWGGWRETSPSCDYAAPATDILVVRSRFAGNRADDAADATLVPQTQGGAIHAESCVRLRVFRSLFEENVADWGGAVSVDHAAAQVEQTVFRRNWTTVPDTGNAYPMGGAFLSINADGAVERPTPELLFRSVLVEGGRAGDPDAASGQLGGCLQVRGDTSKPSPVPASARVRTTIADSAFVGCGVGHLHPDLALIRGGAIDTNRADLRISNTLFALSRADGGAAATGRGSGIALRDDSVATFTGDVVFAGGFADVPAGSPADVDLYVLDSSWTGAIEEWAEQPPSKAGMLVAAPSIPASPGGPFAGEAWLTWAWAGSSAALDGEPVAARAGRTEAVEGAHALAVEGLAAGSRCAATVAPPVEPATSLGASPRSIPAGGSTSLGWATPDGEFLAAIVDRGLGERDDAGSCTVSPAATTTFRRLAFTTQGGASAEETVGVGEAPPPADALFRDGFEAGTGAWDTIES